MNILFVCTGNVSRSYLAEMLLRHELSRRGLEGISVSSAGLYATPGSPPDREMLSYLIEQGIPAGEHRARPLGPGDIAWADRIYVMEERQKQILEETWPEARNKVMLLGAYISGVGQIDDIVDPFGRGPYQYRLSQSQIALAVARLAEALEGEGERLTSS